MREVTMPAGKRIKPKEPHKPSPPVPASFVPEFWVGLDHRLYLVKEVNRRVRVLTEDTAADSEAKLLLIQRAAFLSLRLETAEVEAARTGKFSAGEYTQQVNTLIGLLKCLGLERAVRKGGTLNEYIEGKAK